MLLHHFQFHTVVDWKKNARRIMKNVELNLIPISEAQTTTRWVRWCVLLVLMYPHLEQVKSIDYRLHGDNYNDVFWFFSSSWQVLCVHHFHLLCDIDTRMPSEECNKIDLALSIVLCVVDWCFCMYVCVCVSMCYFPILSNFLLLLLLSSVSFHRLLVNCLMKRKNPCVIQYACCYRFY